MLQLNLVSHNRATFVGRARKFYEAKILFVIGLTIIIGLQKTIVFFTRRQKLKGTAAFTSGVILILLRWPLIGFLVELYGIFILFGDFFATMGSFAGNIPLVGPYIQKALNQASQAGGGRRNAELPV
ncbi:MAG: hypothetical protein Q9211_000298 [Gyalolechia sp. 1 TL-2023]